MQSFIDLRDKIRQVYQSYNEATCKAETKLVSLYLIICCQILLARGSEILPLPCPFPICYSLSIRNSFLLQLQLPQKETSGGKDIPLLHICHVPYTCHLLINLVSYENCGLMIKNPLVSFLLKPLLSSVFGVTYKKNPFYETWQDCIHLNFHPKK